MLAFPVEGIHDWEGIMVIPFMCDNFYFFANNYRYLV